MLEIKKLQIKQNKTRRTTQPKYIIIHDTANTAKGADAFRHYLYFNTTKDKRSADFLVDDKQIIKINDYTKFYTWHCGDKRNPIVSNYNSIGIEMCINYDSNRLQAKKNLVDLVVYLLKELKLTPAAVLRHYDVTGKICPSSMRGNNWQEWWNLLAEIKASYKLETEKTKFLYNGKIFDTDYIYKDNNIYVPIRKITNILGKNIKWDAYNRCVEILD